jgi:hypothetical protein
MAAQLRLDNQLRQIADDPAEAAALVRKTCSKLLAAPDLVEAVDRIAHGLDTEAKVLVPTVRNSKFESAPGLLEAACELLLLTLRALTASVAVPQLRQQRRQRQRSGFVDTRTLVLAVECAVSPFAAMTKQQVQHVHRHHCGSHCTIRWGGGIKRRLVMTMHARQQHQ